MSRKSNAHESHLTILEAVENISNLAEMESTDKLGMFEDHLVIHHSSEEEEDDLSSLETIRWLDEKNTVQTETLVSDTFKTVLHYVKDFRQKDAEHFYEEKTREGIRKIMLLVGKACDKLTECTDLFKGVHKEGIADTDEYKQLNKFYNERIAVENKEKVSLIDLSRYERNLEIKKHPLTEENEETLQARKFVVDVNEVKGDRFYDLLSLRRDDGSYFMSGNLRKDLKLSCRFGDFLPETRETRPLEGIEFLIDRSMRQAAVDLLRMLKPYLHGFFKESMRYKDMELVAALNKAFMALMLAAYAGNSAAAAPEKRCTAYFHDFQGYLREALTSFEYQKLRNVPPPPSSSFLRIVLDLLYLTVWGFYVHDFSAEGMEAVSDDMIEEALTTVREKKKTESAVAEWPEERLLKEFFLVNRYLKKYPIGPAYKVLKGLEEDALPEEFDTLFDLNLPFEMANVRMGEKELSLIRLPSPTHQEFVNKVFLHDEFIGLLDAYEQSSENKTLLIINFQDRTSWREHPRCKVLESLPKNAEHLNHVHVVTLTKNNEFYHQTGLYEKGGDAVSFLKQFLFHLHSEESGFFIPSWMKKQFFSGFAQETMRAIHRLFFDGKKRLTPEERRDFIDIFYLFFMLKAVEVTGADILALTCKDGLDLSGTVGSELYLFLKWLGGSSVNEKDMDKLRLWLFALPLFLRERTVREEDLKRSFSALGHFRKFSKKHSRETVRKLLNDHFGHWYEETTLRPVIQRPSLKKLEGR